MSLLSTMWEPRQSPENPSTKLSDPDSWFIDWATGGGPSEAGVTVGRGSALRVAAFFACIRILAESLASLPAIIYERLDNGGKRRAVDHPTYRIIHDEPNPLMSSFVFYETLQGHVASEGNAYAFIKRNGSGRAFELWPMPPQEVEPAVSKAGELLYNLSGDTRTRFGSSLLPREVLHVPGLGFDGIRGFSPLHIARESLGVAIAANTMAARLFATGGRPSGILSTDANLRTEQVNDLRESWKKSHEGSGNQQKTAILYGGLKWQQVTINPEEAQFLESRKFQIAEIARMFRIPLHMLQELDKATFSNIEQQALEFVQHTLRPWLIRWESELNRKLFSEVERRRFFVEFLVDALLRGDIKSRSEALVTAVGGPFLSVNEAREIDNHPKIEGGNEVLRPLNMTTVGAPPGTASELEEVA